MNLVCGLASGVYVESVRVVVVLYCVKLLFVGPRAALSGFVISCILSGGEGLKRCGLQILRAFFYVCEHPRFSVSSLFRRERIPV